MIKHVKKIGIDISDRIHNSIYLILNLKCFEMPGNERGNMIKNKRLFSIAILIVMMFAFIPANGVFADENANQDSIAEKINKAGGIVASDLVVWQNAKTDDIQWKDGTKLSAGVTAQELKDAYNSATFMDGTAKARKTDVAGTYVGKIKVVFKDNSSLEVGSDANPQKLIVKDHVLSGTESQYPKDAIKVQFMLGEGTTVEKRDPNSGQITNKKDGDKDHPLVYSTYLVKPGTDLGMYKHPILHDTIFNLIGAAPVDGYEMLSWSGENNKNSKDYVVRADNKVFTAMAAKKSKKTGSQIVKPNKMQKKNTSTEQNGLSGKVNKDSKSKNETVNTADNSDIEIYITIASMLIIAALGMRIYSRKK